MALSHTTVMAEVDRHVALEQLYIAHGPALRQALARLAPELDADDLLHEVFLTAVRRWSALETADAPLPWLYGVAVKLASTRRRTARLRRFLGLQLAEAPERHAEPPERHREQLDAQRLVLRALEALSSTRREVFVLYELQGLSGEEIAAALDIPLKTVWTRLFYARRALAPELEKLLEAEAARSGLTRKELAP